MKDITNQQFGRLTAKEPVRKEKGKGIIWRCECSCGGVKEVRAAYLLNGHTQSCGCILAEQKRNGHSFWHICGNIMQMYQKTMSGALIETQEAQRLMDFFAMQEVTVLC